ncbi:MAG TPA: YdeI/OmpD-associated family protein [Acidobacteriaceae bacterium]|jgi:uncharacterized protein YdeI (YjbR/CyaY-like superfamily)|nr:YdeI/OmpD-associated family protein [Acidobacteriaceae bacterium]
MAMKQTIQWHEEIEQLRTILLSSGLTEERKWGKACFTWQGKNIAIVVGLKASCKLLFFKGALLKDAKGLLDKPGQHTQAGRWLTFTSTQEITKLKPTLKTYIQEAIAAEKSGLKVTLKKTSEFPMPAELRKKFKQLPALKKAFTALTPGRQRAYLLYFSSAKQSTTRESRIEKYKQQILAGKGLND